MPASSSMSSIILGGRKQTFAVILNEISARSLLQVKMGKLIEPMSKTREREANACRIGDVVMIQLSHDA